jgi:ABC-type nitrate/sulfonate/bicarbonate transport system substrate-binding protein
MRWKLAASVVAAIWAGTVAASGQTHDKVKLVYPEATGSHLVLLAVAQQQGFFKKYGVDFEAIPARGATVRRLSSELPMGLIGEPAAIIQTAEGNDLRIVASLSIATLSGHLVARPEIKNVEDLRGKRLGVRVLGAGLWISTIIALEQLGLNPQRDGITTVSIGGPAEIVRALEDGVVDGALVSAERSRELQRKGYSVLLQDYPAGISTFGSALTATAGYLLEHPDVARKVTAALVEALAFSFAERNKSAVMQAFKTSLNITDPDTAASNLAELRRKPYASLTALQGMQRVMAMHDPRLAKVDVKSLIDDRFVRELDESGTIASLYAAYGVK